MKPLDAAVLRRVFVALISLALILGMSLGMAPARAIENGVSAQGNKAIVPIYVKTNGEPKGCSGAVLTPRIIATAGHCIIDSNGEIYKDVKVGPPGGSAQLDSTWISMYSVFSITGYKSGSTVRFNDIAFLVLRDPIVGAEYAQVPSEDQVNYMRQASTGLELIGYGATRDSDRTAPIYPSRLAAVFSAETSNTFTNSGYAQSTAGDTCVGDSGGPVLATLSGQSYVVGIITGATQSINCSLAESGGFFTSFTLLHRYTNILFMAANEAAALDIQSLTSKKDDADSMVTILYADLAAARKEIAKLQAKTKSTTITCIKGSSTKKVSGINPKCPTGYKKK